jgi:predicted ATP-grasp superfamily ATP-dependent carboligase
LAAAARRAGYRPLVTDFFCDADTMALAERAVKLPGNLQDGIDGSRVVETLRRLADGGPGSSDGPVAVVLGSGFERQPETVDEVARHFPLAGSSGGAIRRIKDPQLLAADCKEFGIPHPEFRWDRPDDRQNWVVKTVGGAGGAHIRRVEIEEPTTGRYFQRFVSGRSVSALFVGDGQAARIAGFSRQWVSPTATTPYRYGGAVRLRRFDREQAATIQNWLSHLVRRSGLVGLCSADLIRTADSYTLIEINPRPGATLDIFDDADAPLIEAHLRASAGKPYRLPRFAGSMASMVTYATKPIARFPTIEWPEWTADRQSPGTCLIAGDPVCTVFARGRSAEATTRLIKGQASRLRRHWEGDRT